MLSHILTVDPTKRYRIEDIRKHKWWNLSPPQTNSQGLIVGYHRIPIDDQILKATVQLGFQHSFTRKCIEANRHNDATTTYYLLLKKFVRDGGISKAYLGSKYFDSTLIEPLRKVAPDCKVLSMQPSQHSIRLHQTSTRNRRRSSKKPAIVSLESEERCTTWSITSSLAEESPPTRKSRQIVPS